MLLLSSLLCSLLLSPLLLLAIDGGMGTGLACGLCGVTCCIDRLSIDRSRLIRGRLCRFLRLTVRLRNIGYRLWLCCAAVPFALDGILLGDQKIKHKLLPPQDHYSLRPRPSRQVGMRQDLRRRVGYDKWARREEGYRLLKGENQGGNGSLCS